MNDMSPTIGHNNPPITEVLSDRYLDDLKLADELIIAAASAPKTIDDDETLNKVAELIKKTRKLEIHLDKAREEEKEPFQAKVESINGFFKATISKLERVRKDIKQAHDDYLQRKAAAEARRLKEEEDRRREEAEKKLREAKDAEDTKNAAASALSELRRLEQEATDARQSAVTEQEQAAANLATAKASLAKCKADAAGLAAEFAARVVAGNPASDGEKSESRTKHADLIEQAKAHIATCEESLRAARQRAIEAKQAQQRAEDEARAKAREVKTAERDQTQALDQAVRETKVADRIAAKVEGPDADLARTRSEHGAVSTLTRRWQSSVIDRTKLDKEALWPHLTGDAISAALYKWMMAQPQDARTMAGAVMEEVTDSQVR